MSETAKITTFSGSTFRHQVIDECLRTSVKEVWGILKALGTAGKIKGAMDNPFDAMKKIGKTDRTYLLKVFEICEIRKEADPTKNKHVLRLTRDKLKNNHGLKTEDQLRDAVAGIGKAIKEASRTSASAGKSGKAKAKVVAFKAPEELKEAAGPDVTEEVKAAAWGAPSILS